MIIYGEEEVVMTTKGYPLAVVWITKCAVGNHTLLDYCYIYSVKIVPNMYIRARYLPGQSRLDLGQHGAEMGRSESVHSQAGGAGAYLGGDDDGRKKILVQEMVGERTI